MKRSAGAFALLILLASSAAVAGEPGPSGDELRKAASRGDLATVQRLLEAGIDVDAPTEHGATALSYAADKGHLEIVKLLIEHGADVEVQDTFYRSTPITWAAYNGRVEVVKLLVEQGAEPSAGLMMAIARDHPEVVRAIAASGKVGAEGLSGALAAAKQQGRAEIVEVLEAAGVEEPPTPDAEVPAEILTRYVGRYRSPQGMSFTISLNEESKLEITVPGQPSLVLGAVDETTFRPPAFAALTVQFEVEDGTVVRAVANQAGTELTFEPEAAAADDESSEEGTPEADPAQPTADGEPPVDDGGDEDSGDGGTETDGGTTCAR